MHLACPICSADTMDGWVAMWESVYPWQKVRWQMEQPVWRWNRRGPAASARVLLKPRIGDARKAHRCPECATVVIVPDPSYDG